MTKCQKKGCNETYARMHDNLPALTCESCHVAFVSTEKYRLIVGAQLVTEACMKAAIHGGDTKEAMARAMQFTATEEDLVVHLRAWLES